PSSRRTPAALVSQPSIGCASSLNRWSYQPGERTPAPYPDANASRPYVQGTQVIVAFTFGRPRSNRSSWLAGGSGLASAGTCQAPQTTAMFWYPSLIAA